MKTITLNLLTGGTIELEVASIHTITQTNKGSMVTVVHDGKVVAQYEVYEVPSRIKHLVEA